MKKLSLKSGFTLVELAIVIVIIAFLVSGVLLGQELVKQAKINNLVKNTESYKSAIMMFKNKYFGLPGDISNHAFYFPGAGITEGNNSGLIDQNSEVYELWRALAAAKLINGSFSGPPSIQPNSFPTDSAGFNYVYRCQPNLPGTGTPWGKSGCWIGASNFAQISLFSAVSAGAPILSAEDSLALDTKFDDGNPSNGKILATRPTSAGVCTDVDAYGGATSGTYNLSDGSKPGCVILVEFNL